MTGVSGRAAGLAYREAGDRDAPPVLLIHGYPESSYMWREAMGALAGAGWRAIAPDLAGYGDSPLDRPGTWERHLESIERFAAELGLGPVVLVTHDWGVMIGLHDSWLAATCLAHGLRILTGNAREFRRVGGLEVVLWR